MIQDLIEGIACYCDTEDQYYALENLCYQFSDDYHKWMKNLNKGTVGENDETVNLYNRVTKSNRDYLARTIRANRANLMNKQSNRGLFGKLIHRNDLSEFNKKSLSDLDMFKKHMNNSPLSEAESSSRKNKLGNIFSRRSDFHSIGK
jgi:hypothetical protein